MKNKIKQLIALTCFKGLAVTSLCLSLLSCNNDIIPPGSKLVRCKIFKPDGTPADNKIQLTMLWDEHNWEGSVDLNKNGTAMLPSVSSKPSHSDIKDQEDEYICYIRSKNGYLVIRDRNLIQKGTKLTLKQGGKISAKWIGDGLELDICSFESYSLPEFSNSLFLYIDKQRIVFDTQRPSGPFIILALSSSCEYKNAGIRYIKWGYLKPGEEINIELGKHIKDYEIKCLLPQNLPENVQIVLSLQPDTENKTKLEPYFCLSKLSKEKIINIAKEGLEEFSFDNWPLQDESFKFIADENWAKVNIMAKQEGNVYLLQSVEFSNGSPRSKTVDLRNNPSLVKLLSN